MTRNVEEQQKAFLHAELHADTNRLQELLTEDFRSIGDQGIQLDKEQWISRHAEFSYRSIDITELTVHWYDRAAILRYAQRSDATWQGIAMTLVDRVSQVWIEQPTGWKLVLQP